MTPKEEIYFCKLVIQCLEGTIDPEGLEELNIFLAARPDASKIYAEQLYINSQLVCPGHLGTDALKAEEDLSEPALDSELWNALAEDEKHAEAFEVPSVKPDQELIQKVVYPPREKRQISKFTIATFIFSIAAMLLFAFMIFFVPVPQAGQEVATVSDMVNAVWFNDGESFHVGRRLSDNEPPFQLKEGIVRITYDEGVCVLIEGPAEFEVAGDLLLNLEYGRVYATVSEIGTGFTVGTPNSKIIDLGTEFGVQTDIDGEVELHVIKGETKLLTGVKGTSKRTQSVTAGQAKQVDAAGDVIREIELKNKKFVREINSRTGIVWRGGTVDLARQLFKEVHFTYEDIEGIGREAGVFRRDPSDVIQVGDTCYVWYRKFGNKMPQSTDQWHSEIWYATSQDQGRTWTEKGVAIGRGPDGAFDSQGVVTPNILVHGDKYYLYYAGAANGFGGNGDEEYTEINKTRIGVAVADTPDGPWIKPENNIVVEPSLDKSALDSFRCLSPSLVIREGKIWLYYAGRQWLKSSGSKKMIIAVADHPLGPFKKFDNNQFLSSSGDGMAVWPYAEGVMSILSGTGAEGPSLAYAQDGGHFQVVRENLADASSVGSCFRGDLSGQPYETNGIEWGISATKQGYGGFYLIRYECNLQKELRD